MSEELRALAAAWPRASCSGLGLGLELGLGLGLGLGSVSVSVSGLGSGLGPNPTSPTPLTLPRASCFAGGTGVRAVCALVEPKLARFGGRVRVGVRP